MIVELFIIISLFSDPGTNTFCTCAPTEKIDLEEIEDYDLIFRGSVQKLDTLNHQRLITFEIKNLYKGEFVNETVTISSSADLSMCGLNIGTEGEWLLFAYKKDGGYSTNSCSRSGMIDSYLHHNKERVRLDLEFLENLN